MYEKTLVKGGLGTMGVVALALAVAPTANAKGDGDDAPRREDRERDDDDDRKGGGGGAFRRIATFPVYINNTDIATETVAEIVDVSEDGKTLVYTDAAQGAVGFVDILDPSNPAPLGTIPVIGSPTSVAVVGKYALVGVDTSASFTAPSGSVLVIDIRTQAVVATLPLAGQPDSLKASPSRKYCAVVIENQRDEEVVVNGVEGGLPQAPAGLLQVIDTVGAPSSWRVRSISLSGLAALAGSDPEPEFVDVNEDDEAVVTLQENNHIVVVDLKTGRVLSSFGAGAVTLTGVDAVEDDVISLTDTLTNVPREPDAVAWIGGSRFATANEGDLFGGSRGFTLFDRRGRVLYDSGRELEVLGVRVGHYPESRSENKGTEPESIEYGEFGGRDYLFVGSERGSFIAVYRVNGRTPRLAQVLPGNLAPEGLLAIPGRNLLVASSEDDSPLYGVRSTIMIYRLEDRPATYPQIVSADDAAGNPIGWSALSGLSAIPRSNRTLLGVWDGYYAQSRIFTIDVSRSPALITSAITLTGGRGNFDPEGITVAPDGSWWVATEGNATDTRRNSLLQVSPTGQVLREVDLPANILACRAASRNRGTLGSGFEGLAAVPQGSGYVLYVAQQRGWDYTTPGCEDLDDDATAANAGEPRLSRIWVYDPVADAWSSIAWELEPVPAIASWVGLSEITRLPDGSFILIERDNRTGDFGTVKTLVRITPSDLADGVVTRAEKQVYDLLPDLLATNGWITDKPEGTAVTPNGRLFVVTDNDGVEDWSGETWFFGLGPALRLFK